MTRFCDAELICFSSFYGNFFMQISPSIVCHFSYNGRTTSSSPASNRFTIGWILLYVKNKLTIFGDNN